VNLAAIILSSIAILLTVVNIMIIRKAVSIIRALGEMDYGIPETSQALNQGGKEGEGPSVPTYKAP